MENKLKANGESNSVRHSKIFYRLLSKKTP